MLKNQSTSENLTNSRSLRLDLNRMRYPAPKYLSNLTNLIKVQGVAPKPLVIFRNYGEKSSTCKEQKLLKFPALKLEETIPKFLKTVEPLVNEAEYKEAEKATQAFAENEGKELQALLEAAAATEENWLAPRWLRHAYLQYRDPVTVYTSPGMTFPLTEFASDEDWCGYTANVVNCLAQFKVMVDQCKMPVVKMGKLELDNSQFGKVFGTNRMPAVKEDIMEYNPNSKHVVVIYKGHFFKMPIFTENGQPIHPKILKAALFAILKNKKEPDVGYGILTTDNRDNWAEAYCILRNKPGNEGVLKEIQSALFTVSLDDHVEFAKDKAWNVQAAQLIHGGGPNQNSKNRWMDKTIQLVVNRNGMSGFTYEHSPAEGQPIAVMMDYCVQQLKDPSKLEGCEDKDLCVEYLRFADADPCIEQWLAVAERNVGKLAAGLQLNIMHFKVYGKDCIKAHKMSPDSFIQIALQYAFYKMYGQPAAQYESAHLRIYYGGRTETIRSCSVEAVCFAKAMLDKSASLKDKVELLKAAVNGHRAYTSMALQGKGVDRHLLGLKLMAIENKLPIPKFFCTPGVLKSSHFRVSTSQVATPNPSFMAYGPSTADGYGCCYNPRDCDIIFAISNWFSNETNCYKFGEILHSCLVEMRSILDESAEQPKSKL